MCRKNRFKILYVDLTYTHNINRSFKLVHKPTIYFIPELSGGISRT